MEEGTTQRKRSRWQAAMKKAKAIRAKKSRMTQQPTVSRGWPRGTAREEMKAFDNTLSTTAVNTTGSVTLLNSIGAGTDINKYIGRRYTIRSIEMRIYGFSQAATGVNQIHRYLLVWDRQPNGALAAIGDIMNDVSAGGAFFDSARSLQNRSRFICLKDWFFTLGGEADPLATEQTTKLFTYYRRHNLKTILNDDGGAIGNIVNGALLFVAIGNIAAGLTDGTVQGQYRLRFSEA